MATRVEAIFNEGLSRGDLLSFARRRPSRRSHPPSGRGSSLLPAPPQPPDWNPLHHLGRRGLVVGGIGLAGIAVGTAMVRSWELFLPSDEKLREGWQKLPAKDRITRLEFKKYPGFSDFDVIKELSSAVAQYYCQVIHCNKPLAKLEQGVFITETYRIIQEIEADNERKLTEVERKGLGDETTEMTGIKSGLVLINKDKLAREVEGFRTNNPNTAAALKEADIYTVLLKSLFFHGFTHVNMDKSSFAISPINLPGFFSVPTTFDTVSEGFIFSGRQANGELVTIHGGDEAITDYIATFAGQDTGAGYLGVPQYISGIRLIEMLNNRAGISPQEFISYCTGRRPKREIFRKWGALKNPAQPDEQAALTALLTIGLRVDHSKNVTQDQAIAKINELLNPR